MQKTMLYTRHPMGKWAGVLMKKIFGIWRLILDTLNSLKGCNVQQFTSISSFSSHAKNYTITLMAYGQCEEIFGFDNISCLETSLKKKLFRHGASLRTFPDHML
uniref:Uncharacterized protein n=1 Tax=Romanomermis culicivorax TaxID=13658 RepID=A0A915J696_ROMCU